MKLTTKWRYAVMAMADLASNGSVGPISLKEISVRQNISLAYLEQIFIKLKNNRLVKSSRGANGGYILDRPAAEIKLSNIYFWENWNGNRICFIYAIIYNLRINTLSSV